MQIQVEPEGSNLGATVHQNKIDSKLQERDVRLVLKQKRDTQ